MKFDVYFMASTGMVRCTKVDATFAKLDPAIPEQRETAKMLWSFQSTRIGLPNRQDDLSLMSCRPLLLPNELDTDEFNHADQLARGFTYLGCISTGQFTRKIAMQRFLREFVAEAEAMPTKLPKMPFGNDLVFRRLENGFRGLNGLPLHADPDTINFKAIKLKLFHKPVATTSRYDF